MVTKIEWCEETWNPITGCTPISEGCKNCYAKRMANRLKGRYGYPKKNAFQVTYHPDRLDQPLKWRKPRKVFVCSMGDLFHSLVSEDIQVLLHEIMCKAEQHTFMILTKRPENMRRFYEFNHSKFNDAGNVWLGVTVETQDLANERIPVLLQIPAAVRFVSYEPAIGAIDLDNIRFDRYLRGSVLSGAALSRIAAGQMIPNATVPTLDWVIAGGESGPGARPAYPSWFRLVRDQCKAAGVPFFFKQWGNSCLASQLPEDTCQRVDAAQNLGNQPDAFWAVGKKAAGRLLDGVEHNEMPGL